MGRKKVAPVGGKQVPADDLLRLLHSQNLGKLRTLVKSGLDPNGFVGNTSCFDNTTWVLKDRKPLVPLLVFSCFNGVPAPVLDLLIRMGASPNAVTDCGLPAPLAVLCAKITAEEQRALLQVLRQHRCSTFNTHVRSARNDLPIHVTCKILDLADWTSPRKVEGVELLIQFGTFQLQDGILDERAMYEFLATAVRHPCGHKLLDCIWRHFPQQSLPSLPVSDCLLFRALTDSWLEPGWRHSEERQHTVSMGLVLRALMEHSALQQPHREAVACWLRLTMTVLLYRPELVASLLDRCKPLEAPAAAANVESFADPSTSATSTSPLFFHPDDRDFVLPSGLLSGPEAGQGEMPLSPNMSLMLAYVIDPDEQLAVQGVEMLLSRGARVDLPCRLGREVLGGNADHEITPLMAAFMPYHCNQKLVDLLWQRYAESQPTLASQEAAIRMRSAAHAIFLGLPGWQDPLASAARAAAAMSTGKAGRIAEVAAPVATTAVTPGSLLIETTPLDCSRERLRDLLDSNVLDYVDNRNLDLVEAALTELLAHLSSLKPQPGTELDAATGAHEAVMGFITRGSCGRRSDVNSNWGPVGAGSVAAKLAAQLDVISERLNRANARLDELYSIDCSGAEVEEDSEAWRMEAAVEALTAVQRCLERHASSIATDDGVSNTCYELPAGVAFVEVIAARIVGQPEWGFSRGLLLQLGLSQMRRVLRALRTEGGETAATRPNTGVGAEGGLQGVMAQMEVLQLYYDELLYSMSVPERRLLEDLVSALEAAEEERDLEDAVERVAEELTAAAAAALAANEDGPVVEGHGLEAGTALHAHLEPSEHEPWPLPQKEDREEAEKSQSDPRCREEVQRLADTDAKPRLQTEGKGDDMAVGQGRGACVSSDSGCGSTEELLSSSSAASSNNSGACGEQELVLQPTSGVVTRDLDAEAATVGSVAGTDATATIGIRGDPDDSASGADSFSVALAQGFLSAQAREVVHRVMLPGELIEDWTSDDEASIDGDDDDGGSSAVAGGDGGGGSGSDNNDDIWQWPGKACIVEVQGGGEAVEKPVDLVVQHSGSSGANAGGRNGRAGCSQKRGCRVMSQRAGVGAKDNLPSRRPPAASQQQSRQRRRGLGAVSSGASGRRRARRLYGSDNGGNETGTFCTAATQGWRNPELLLRGFNIMSLPPNVRRGSGGGDGNDSSRSSDRELKPYEYMGAAVMLQNYEDGVAVDSVSKGAAARYVSSAASSAYDTPSEGSGEDTGSLLEAQIRACNTAAAAAAAVSRRLYAGPDASSGESYGSAQGGYGSGHGYGPEYGMESVGDDTGALDYGMINRQVLSRRSRRGGSGGSGGSGSGRGGRTKVGINHMNEPLIPIVGVAATLAYESVSDDGEIASPLLLPLPPPLHPRKGMLHGGEGDCQQWCSSKAQQSKPYAAPRSPSCGYVNASAFDVQPATLACKAATPCGGTARDQQSEGSRTQSSGKTSSSSASVNFMPRMPREPTQLLQQAPTPTALSTIASAAADRVSRGLGPEDGAAAASSGRADVVDGAACGGAAATLLGMAAASAPVSRSSSSSSLVSSSSGDAGVASCRSSLDSTRACIVHKPSATAHAWYGLWTDSREADRGLMTAVATATSMRGYPHHPRREGSPAFRRSEGYSDDDYVHTYDFSYDCGVSRGGGGGSGGGYTAGGGEGGSSRPVAGPWGERSCDSCKVGPGWEGSPVAAGEHSWENGSRRHGVVSSSGDGFDTDRVVGPGRWDLRDSSGGGGASDGVGKPALQPTPAGYPGRGRRRVVVRRTHAASGLMPTAAAAQCGADAGPPPFPLRQFAIPLPLQPQCAGPCSCSDTSDGISLSSSRGGSLAPRGGSHVSYGSDGSVVATMGQARQQRTSGRDCNGRVSSGNSIDSCSDSMDDGSDGSVAFCPGLTRPVPYGGRNGGGNRSGDVREAGTLNGAAIHSASRNRGGGNCNGGGSGGSEHGYNSNASSTSTQEWPPRRPPNAFSARARPTVSTSGRDDVDVSEAATRSAMATAADLMPVPEAVEPWKRTPQRDNLGSEGSSEGELDSPGSVGFSGRRSYDGSESEPGSETGPGSENESYGFGGGDAAIRVHQPQSESESGSSSSVPSLYGRMYGWQSSSTVSSDSTTTSRPAPGAGRSPKCGGSARSAAAEATGARPSVEATAALRSIAGHDALAAAIGNPISNARVPLTAAAFTASVTTEAKNDGENDINSDDGVDGGSPGVNGCQGSSPDSPVPQRTLPIPSTFQLHFSASHPASPTSQQPHLKKQQQQTQPLPSQWVPLAAAPGATAAAIAAAPSFPGGADRTLFALLGNLATSAHVFPRSPWECPSEGIGAGVDAKRVSGSGLGAGSTRATGSDGGGAPGGGGCSGGLGLQNCFVLQLSGATPKEGYTPPPPAVMQLLFDGPSSPEALSSWTAELRTALVTSSRCEHQRLVVVADAPVRLLPVWLASLRSAIVGAVIGPALGGGDGVGSACGGRGGDAAHGRRGDPRDRPTCRRQCPEWLRQTILLLPLCHLVAPYGGAYLYQAASRACQEFGSSPGAFASSGRCRGPRLWLDAECLAAATAFMEAYPGNVYGRAILMLYVDRQISRVLLRSPRYGLRGLARSAEMLAELLYGSGCCGGIAANSNSGGGGGNSAGATAAAGTTAVPAAGWPCGPMGQIPSAAQALLLLVDEEDGTDEGEGRVEFGDRDGDNEGWALRAASMTCHVMGSALSAARQMQAVWRATWPGGHALRLASYSYLAANGYPRAVVSALNRCVPLVLDGAADLSELLSEMRLLSYNASTAILMAEEIFVPQHFHDVGWNDGGGGGDEGAGQEDAEEDNEAETPQDHGSDTALAFRHLINALRASTVEPPGTRQVLRPELVPWSDLCTTQREQLVDELLTLADLLMIAHAVLLTLRTALSFAADGGAAVTAAAAGALRREVAEVQTMRAAASRMLVERMETQERSPELLYANHLHNHRNRYLNRHQDQPHGAQNRQPNIRRDATASSVEKVSNMGRPYGSDSGIGDGDGGWGIEEELYEHVDETVSWRYVNGLYEHGKIVLQCAADTVAAMLDPQSRADDAARYERLVNALLDDQDVLEGLNSLAAMPPHYKLPLAPWDPDAAAAAAAAMASGGGGGDVSASSDPAPEVAMGAAAAATASSFSQCNEVLYRLLVLPWSDRGGGEADGGDSKGNGVGDSDGDGGGVSTSLAEEFERSSWTIPTFPKGDFRPLTQQRVRRLYDEVRALAAECLASLNRIVLQPPSPLCCRCTVMEQSEAGTEPAMGTRGEVAENLAEHVGLESAGDGETYQHPVAVASAASAAEHVIVATKDGQDAREDGIYGCEEDARSGESGSEVEGLDDPA